MTSNQQINDGGPAFPPQSQLEARADGGVFARGDYEPHETGMSLRAYIATAAMKGMLANSTTFTTAQRVAELAVGHADTLIAELAKGGASND